jgi:hypothetical protein
VSNNDYEVIDRFLGDCEVEMRQEADELDMCAKAEPSEHNKKAALGARWTMHHLREIRKRLENRVVNH